MSVTFLPGTLESISANFINPYTGEILAINGDYYVNDTYVNGGTATDDILLSTTQNQFFSLEDELGNLLIEDFEQIIMNAGDDILNLASAIHVMGDMYIQMDDGNDIVWANAGNDTIVGGTGDDILHGGPGHDNIQGGSDNDTLTGAQGDDIIDGGSGYDTAVFLGNYTNYMLTVSGGTMTVIDNIGTDGTDNLTFIERLQFADGFYENGVFTPNTQTFIATAVAEAFAGSAGIDTVDYSDSLTRVRIYLYSGTGADGFAAGDTYTSIENIIGADLNNATDVIYGDAGVNHIWGMNGHDIIEGEDGADIIDGGAGADYAYYTRSDAGVDVDLTRATQIGGHAQGDELISIEHLRGSNHGDIIVGNAGGNNLFGEKGNDILSGGAGNDKLYGGWGDDTFIYTSGKDYIHDQGTGNFETVIFSSTWTPMDVIIAGNVLNFKDNITDRITFNDISLIEEFLFDGYAPMDLATLQSFAAPLTVIGTEAADVLSGTLLAESFDGLTNVDTVDYSSSTTRIKVYLFDNKGTEGFAAGDTYTSIENIIGADLHNETDVIFGNAGANHIWGMDGHDILEGEAGADIIDGGEGRDYANYTRSNAAVDIDLTRETQIGGHAQGDVLIDIEHLRGSDFNDSLYGDAGRNNIYGGSGNDTLVGNAGDDTLDGENGNDSLLAGDGNDVLRGGNGVDTLQGGNGDDYLYGGAGVDILSGQSGADTYVFEDYTTAFSSIDQVYGFSISEGDRLNVADLLVGYDPITDAITDFVQIQNAGSNSTLSVDLDGGGDNFIQIATLYGITALTDEEALETAGTLITA